MNKLVNCWNTLRAETATTQPETVNVNAGKCFGLGNQQPSACEMAKVRRSGETRRGQVAPKSESSRTDEDMTCTCGKLQEQKESNTCTVYGLLATGDDHYRYIGQTMQSLGRRLAGHLSMARNTKKPDYLYRWIRKSESLGKKITIHEIEANCALDDCEIQWISHYRSKYSDMVNISFGGTHGVYGVRRSEETKRKMRGPKAESTKLKMRKPKSEETKIKMSQAQIGNTKGVGSKNGLSKLNENDVVEIKQRISRGESLSRIFPIYGVTKATISKIRSGRTWKHVCNDFA